MVNLKKAAGCGSAGKFHVCPSAGMVDTKLSIWADVTVRVLPLHLSAHST